MQISSPTIEGDSGKVLGILSAGSSPLTLLYFVPPFQEHHVQYLKRWGLSGKHYTVFLGKFQNLNSESEFI